MSSLCFLAPRDLSVAHDGVSRVAGETARAAAAAGHEVDLLVPSRSEPCTVWQEGVRRHEISIAPRSIALLADHPAAGPLAMAAAMYLRVCELRAAGRAVHVIAPAWSGAGLFCVLDGRLDVTTRLITSAATLAALRPELEQEPWLRAQRAMEREAYLASRRVLAASRAVARDAERSYGEPAGDVHLVPLGAADRFRAASPSAGGAEVLFVGRLEHRKGIDVLLAAAEQLAPQFPALRLTIAGEDTVDPRTGELYGRGLPHPSWVDFLGAIDDEHLWDLYARADIIVVPSRYESYGNVVVEALMFGKPLVTCAVGGIPEVVEHGRSALLVAPDDAGALAGAIGRLLADRRLRRALGAGARRRYEQQNRLESTTAAVLAAVAGPARIPPQAPPATPGPQLSFAERAAAAVQSVTGLDAPDAACVSEALLDPGAYPVDHARALADAWYLPQPAFVAAVYLTLLGREPDSAGGRWWVGRLDAGAERMALVEQLAATELARARHVPSEVAIRVQRLQTRELPARLSTAEMLDDDESFVRVASLGALGRELAVADRARVMRSLAALQLSRAELAAALAGSPEGMRTRRAAEPLPA